MSVNIQNQFLPFNYQIDLMGVLRWHKGGMDSLSSIKTIEYKRQEYIYNLGDCSNKIYIVKSGRVQVKNNTDDSKTIIKNVFMEGELFGEFSLVGESYRTDYAMAMERTELYVFTPEELYAKMQDNHNLTAYIIYLLGSRSIATEQKIESFVFKKSRTRIIEFLCELAKNDGQRIGYEIVVRNFFTHQEIANITATSRQTVTTLLNELRNNKILTFNRKRLLIRDLDLLRAEAFR